MPGTKVADAYVSIIPETKGFGSKLKSGLGGQSEGIGNSVGGKIGGALVGKIVGMVAAAGIGTAIVSSIKQAINNGAQWEQLSGGAELMLDGYEDAYNQLIENAKNAYSKVGLSQNEYLEQTNGLLTGLKTALGGNGDAAADLADKIVTAEADVVAATGASQDAVQNAFNGIMKSNYTMLDNLQLGIAPTKAGMQEVIDKVNEWNAANGEATSYTIDNYADVQNALIDYIEMQGMAGYAAEEGATTFEGSMNAMKSAWDNVLTSLTTGEGDVSDAMEGLGETVSNFVVDNLIPMLGEIISNIPTFIKTFFTTAVPEILTNIGTAITEASGSDTVGEAFQTMLDNAITWLTEQFPTILDNGVAAFQEWVNGWGEGDGTMMEVVGQTIAKIIEIVGLFEGQIVMAGLQIVWALVQGIIQNIPYFSQQIAQMIFSGLQQIIGFDGEFQGQGANLVQFLIFGIASFIPQIIAKIREMIQNMKQKFKETNWSELGRNIITGIITGISNAAQNLFSSLKDLASNALSAAKEALGIASPSKEFKKQVGQWIPEGIAVGINANASSVTEAMDSIANDALTTGVNMSTSIGSMTSRNVSADNGGNMLAEVYTLLTTYLPQCAAGLQIDGTKMANEMDYRLGNMQVRRANVW